MGGLNSNPLSLSLSQRRFYGLVLCSGGGALLDAPFLQVVAILMNPISCEARSATMDSSRCGQVSVRAISNLGHVCDILGLEAEIINHALRELRQGGIVPQVHLHDGRFEMFPFLLIGKV